MTNTLGKTPLMKRYEIRAIEKAILSFNKLQINILEWGSGGSTIYFSKFLRDNNIKYSWTSVEYNRKWFDQVSRSVQTDKDVTLKLFDVGNVGLKQRYTNMEDYINFPKTLNKKFDLIIVDGRKRRRCLLESKKLLSEGGIVFLHDAQRKYYQCAFSKFNNNSMIGPFMWMGRLNEISDTKRRLNILKTSFFKVLFLFIINPWQAFKRTIPRK